MRTTTLTSAWDAILMNFLPVFTQPTAPLFVNLVTGWILCTGRRTVTGILPFADPAGTRPHDAYHRLFGKSCWQPADLWKRLAEWLIGLFYPSGMIWLDLDDTVFHHTGKKIEGAGWWRDAVRSTVSKVVHCWGLNLVVLTLRVNPPWGGEPLGLPINMRLHRKDEGSLITLAEQMLQEVRQWFPKRTFTVDADGFYATLVGRERASMHLVSRIRHDAAIYDLPKKKPPHRRGRQPQKGKRLPTPTQLARRTQSWQRIKTRERGKTRYRLVVTQVVI